MRTLRACASVFRIRLAETLQYRMASLSQCVNVVVFILVKIVMISVFYTHGENVLAGEQAGLTLGQAISYQWLVHALWPMMNMDIDGQIRKSIVSGDVGIELCRPVNLYALWTMRVAAGRVVPVTVTALPMLLVGVLLNVFGIGLGGPASALGLLASLASFLAAFLLGTAYAMLMTAVRLGITWGEGPTYILMLISGVLSGGYLPLQLWPQALQPLLLWQPFAGGLDIPVRLYLGTAAPGQALGLIGLQLFWTAMFTCLGRLVMRRRLSKITVQGG